MWGHQYVPCFFVVIAFLVAHLSQLTEWHTLSMCGGNSTLRKLTDLAKGALFYFCSLLASIYVSVVEINMYLLLETWKLSVCF